MRYSLLFLSLLSLSACYEEPEFPVEPRIEFEQVQFYDIPNETRDELAITVSFTDGDGNLGLGEDALTSPFHPFNFTEFNGPGRYLKLGDLDTLPAYNCNDYVEGFFTGISPESFILTSDTAYFVQNSDTTFFYPEFYYVKRNPFHSNFFVEFFIVENGEEIPFDFAAESGAQCQNDDYARFYPIGDSGEPLSGSITYKKESSGYKPYFSNDSIKIKVRIADRALNLSNVVESPVFTLQQISVN